MYAARNIDLCTKDCLCLFVCPTGATDTENGTIDKAKCLEGCRLCVDACPSGAIYLVYEHYPEPARKDAGVSEALNELLEITFAQERIAGALEKETSLPGKQLIARALKRSLRILAEDCARESGYMLPQCNASKELIRELRDKADKDPAMALDRLLAMVRE